ncbi:hypothetical protein RIF29_45988 [Crotalaria pallida]
MPAFTKERTCKIEISRLNDLPMLAFTLFWLPGWYAWLTWIGYGLLVAMEASFDRSRLHSLPLIERRKNGTARSMSRYETMPTFRPLFDHSFVSVLALYAYAAVVSVELDISPAIGRLRIQGSELEVESQGREEMPLGQVSLKLGSGIRSSIVGCSSRGDILLSTALCYRFTPLPVRRSMACKQPLGRQYQSIIEVSVFDSLVN